jgi:hypothetical protein
MKPIATSRQTLAVAVALATVALAAIAWWVMRPGNTDDTAVLAARTVQAGAVEVTMTPLALDASGAAFQVKLDTHSVELDLDMASSAHLRIDGSTVDGASWDGQGPGGHHREGTLRFATPVPTGANVELRIAGLPTDATGSWTAP